MLRLFGDFLSSIFNADLYTWAANERRGVGLSYLLGVSLLVVIGATIYSSYNFGADWAAMIAIENKVLPESVRVYFSVIIPHELLVLLVLPAISWLLLTLILFNLAVISAATIGQAMNYLYGEALEFDQVLRINCYVVVISLALAQLAFFFFPQLMSLSTEIILGLIVLYNFYGVMFIKFDF